MSKDTLRPFVGGFGAAWQVAVSRWFPDLRTFALTKKSASTRSRCRARGIVRDLQPPCLPASARALPACSEAITILCVVWQLSTNLIQLYFRLPKSIAVVCSCASMMILCATGLRFQTHTSGSVTEKKHDIGFHSRRQHQRQHKESSLGAIARGACEHDSIADCFPNALLVSAQLHATSPTLSFSWLPKSACNDQGFWKPQP